MGMGVGINCFGAYYFLTHTGALPPGTRPAGGLGNKETDTLKGELADGGVPTAAAVVVAEQATPVYSTRRWW